MYLLNLYLFFASHTDDIYMNVELLSYYATEILKDAKVKIQKLSIDKYTEGERG